MIPLGMLAAATPRAAVGVGYPVPLAFATSAMETSASSISVNLPTASAGDLLIMVIGLSAGLSRGINTPSGWSLGYFSGNSTSSSAVFFKVATGSEGAAVTVDFTGTGPRAAAIVARIEAGSHTGEIHVSTASSTGTNVVPPNSTPPWSGKKGWLIAFSARNAGAVSSYPCPAWQTHARPVSGDTTSAAEAASCWAASAAGTLSPGFFVKTQNQVWTAFTIAIRGAP